jgi:ribonuclease HIII
MKICVYPIKSVLAYGDTISKESAKLLNDLTAKTGYEFSLVGLDELSKGDLRIDFGPIRRFGRLL